MTWAEFILSALLLLLFFGLALISGPDIGMIP